MGVELRTHGTTSIDDLYVYIECDYLKKSNTSNIGIELETGVIVSISELTVSLAEKYGKIIHTTQDAMRKKIDGGFAQRRTGKDDYALSIRDGMYVVHIVGNNIVFVEAVAYAVYNDTKSTMNPIIIDMTTGDRYKLPLREKDVKTIIGVPYVENIYKIQYTGL